MEVVKAETEVVRSGIGPWCTMNPEARLLQYSLRIMHAVKACGSSDVRFCLKQGHGMQPRWYHGNSMMQIGGLA
jgi:hypothetical protein